MEDVGDVGRQVSRVRGKSMGTVVSNVASSSPVRFLGTVVFKAELNVSGTGFVRSIGGTRGGRAMVVKIRVSRFTGTSLSVLKVGRCQKSRGEVGSVVRDGFRF